MGVFAVIGGAIAGLDFAGILAGYAVGKSIDTILAKLKKDTWQKQLVHALFLSLYEANKKYGWEFDPNAVSGIINKADKNDASKDWGNWLLLLLERIFDRSLTDDDLDQWYDCFHTAVVNQDYDKLFKKLQLDRDRRGLRIVPAPLPVPFKKAIGLQRRNELFTGRADTLSALAEGFAGGNAISLSQTIAGLGGVGKSQTALEYAHLHVDEYNDAVWWVNAESPMEDCRKLLIWFGFPDDVYEESKVHAAWEQWCGSFDSWLLIFDNAEDNEKLKRWLPKSVKGHVLITTREKLAFQSFAKPIDLDVFSAADAMLFLTERLPHLPVDGTANTLAAQLGRLPLAMDQAASYILATGGTYAEYLDELEEYGLELLKKGKGVDYEEVVTTTWQISMKKLSAAATELLYLCSYLAPDGMILALFSETTAEHLPPALREIAAHKLKRKDAIAELVKYSLLKRGEDGLHSMHRLVQRVIRGEADNKDTVYLAADLEILVDVLSDIKYATREDYDYFLALSDHAVSVVDFAELAFAENEERLKTVVGGLYRLARGYKLRGEYDTALIYYKRNLALNEKIYGAEHTETAAAYNNLGLLYNDMGNLEKALEMYQKDLAISEKVLGLEHPDTATTYNNLGVLYRTMGNHEQALEMHQKALAIREKVLGLEHPDTAQSYNNLGALYHDMGDYKKALGMYEKSLTIQEKVLGKEHPSTAATHYNLGMLYHRSERYEQALEWFSRAFKIWMRVLGEEHPHTQLAFGNLRYAFVANGGKAEEFADWLAEQLRQG